MDRLISGVSWPSGSDNQTRALVFLISRVWVRVLVVTPVFLSKTLNHDTSSFGLDVEPLVPCVMHRTQGTYHYRRGSTQCSWFDWQ